MCDCISSGHLLLLFCSATPRRIGAREAELLHSRWERGASTAPDSDRCAEQQVGPTHCTAPSPSLPSDPTAGERFSAWRHRLRSFHQTDSDHRNAFLASRCVRDVLYLHCRCALMHSRWGDGEVGHCSAVLCCTPAAACSD